MRSYALWLLVAGANAPPHNQATGVLWAREIGDCVLSLSVLRDIFFRLFSLGDLDPTQYRYHFHRKHNRV